MTPEVLRVIRQLVPATEQLQRVALLSPSREERAMFPHAQVFTVKDWDLGRPKPELRADLIIASHVFHYAADPALWFDNVRASCRAFLCLDLIRRKRSAEAELGKDGDRMRYSVGEHRAVLPGAFELSALGEQVLALRTFDGGRNEHGEALHFAALLEGKLRQPLLRVDDYPTGVRPIAEDLQPLHDVLLQFEARQLDYHLGIVPAITDAGMFEHLRALRHMVPAQHGYDHKYPKYSQLLQRRGDPGNDKGTVGAFNEFAWQRYGKVERTLALGKQRLEGELGRAVDVYIPPCNRCNRTTAKALARLGFRLCLSERPAPGSHLPTLASGFYGRSAQLGSEQGRPIPDVVSLHATWEADLLRRGDRQTLPNALDRVVDHGRAKAEAVRGLAAALLQVSVV
jgi:peptidoglycan/xylan/chitin deacetylase (PgdA/CDA1 family)